MKFFGIFSLLILLSLLSCFNCYVFKCSFLVARKKKAEVYTSPYYVGCDGEFISYDGEGFERLGNEWIADLASMMALDFTNKNDVSALAEKRIQKPALEVTEYVSFTTHHSSIIPKGIGSKFPNIKHFMFNFGTLSKLSRENLKQFPKAMSFDFKSNKLEYLEEDLFADNSKLIFVELEDNNIMQVSSNIGLFRVKKLFYIHMERNRCIDEIFYCDSCDDEKLETSLREYDTMLINKCADMGIMRSQIESIKSTVDGQTKNINEMKVHMSQMDQGFENLNSGLSEVQGTVNDHSDYLIKVTEQITEISGNLLKIQDSVENFSKIFDRNYNLKPFIKDQPDNL